MSGRNRYLVTGLAAVGLLLAACSDEVPTTDPTVAYDVTGTPNKQDWKQCTNDHSYESECSWTTGNLTHAHNTYAEGDFVPKVLRVGGINNEDPFHIRMTYGFQKGGLTTHDFLGLWNDDMVNANPCTDGSFSSFCTNGFPILDLVNSNSMAALSQAAVDAVCGPASQKSADMAQAIASEAGKLIIQGLNVVSIDVTHIEFDGCPASGDAEAFLDMTITPTLEGVSDDILLLFGAHVARSDQWDNGGAAGVSGSPYHLGLVTVDGESAGSMDLQMSAAAVVAPEPEAAITIGQDGTNEVGDPHLVTGTVTVQADVGEPFAPAPDGTQIDFAIESGPGILSASSCLTTGGTGSCSVTLSSDDPGVTVVSASSTLIVSEVELTVTTDGAAPNSDNLQKTWVDAKIEVSPLTATNPVGEAHEITATVTQYAGVATGSPAPDGTLVLFSLLNNTAGATFVGDVNTCSTTAGSCSVFINSTSAGSVDIRATTTFNVLGESVTRTTGSGGNNSADANKVYANARISIGEDGVNEVGENHTFTVKVERDDGAGYQPVDGQLVTATKTGDGDFVNDSCTTDATGECDIEVSSSATGTMEVTASALVAVNGSSLTISTDESGDNSGPATKTWVDAYIEINPPEDTNPVNDQHTFTVTVWEDDGSGGGFARASGETVTATQSGNLAGLTLGGSCTGAGVTDGNGECTFTATSAAVGNLTLTAHSDVEVGGIIVSVSTDGTGNNSAAAEKDWVDARISILGTGTNEVGTTHTFTVRVEEKTGSAGAAFVAAAGETVTANLIQNDFGATSAITGGSCTNGGVTDSDGECTIEISSNTTGQTIFGASSLVQVDGTGVQTAIVSSDANLNTRAATGPAIKTWVDAHITIAEDGTNPIGEEHTFTVTVKEDAGDGNGFVAALGETVTFSTSGSAGSITGGTCTGGGLTDALGQCTVIVNSNVEGSITVTAISDVSVGGESLNRTTDGSITPSGGQNSGPATKTWFEICKTGERLVSITFEVNAISGAGQPLDFDVLDGNGNKLVVLESSPGEISVGDSFTITPDGGAQSFVSQNLRFEINGQSATGTVHLSCSDDPAIGDIHIITENGISVTLEKTALLSDTKN